MAKGTIAERVGSSERIDDSTLVVSSPHQQMSIDIFRAGAIHGAEGEHRIQEGCWVLRTPDGGESVSFFLLRRIGLNVGL